jgi:nucleoside phosphorylase
VVVFTALDVEYEAIREYLDGPFSQREERGTLYEVGALTGVRGSWRVAVTQTGPGSTTAGVQVDRAIPIFGPEIVLFLGVAGGRKDVALGDVVAADTIYDYESGKSTLKGYQPRIRTHHCAYRLVQRARLVSRENRWQQRIRPPSPLPPPASFIKPIATGSKVVTHDRSAVARLLDQHTSDALAVETEGHGFLEGAYVNPGVDALVIRGISDLLVGKDQASDKHWQPIASRHAAAVAVELLDSLGTNMPRSQ